ncbi:MAG TPA: hypothetical protein VGO47_03400, partial [Chlamydiales bacterium]|nr:hypothetical protein [Chlamydiales bacterium]
MVDLNNYLALSPTSYVGDIVRKLQRRHLISTSAHASCVLYYDTFSSCPLSLDLTLEEIGAGELSIFSLRLRIAGGVSQQGVILLSSKLTTNVTCFQDSSNLKDLLKRKGGTKFNPTSSTIMTHRDKDTQTTTRLEDHHKDLLQKLLNNSDDLESNSSSPKFPHPEQSAVSNETGMDITAISSPEEEKTQTTPQSPPESIYVVSDSESLSNNTTCTNIKLALYGNSSFQRTEPLIGASLLFILVLHVLADVSVKCCIMSLKFHLLLLKTCFNSLHPTGIPSAIKATLDRFPMSMPALYRWFPLSSHFVVYASCPKCARLYPPDTKGQYP